MTPKKTQTEPVLSAGAPATTRGRATHRPKQPAAPVMIDPGQIQEEIARRAYSYWEARGFQDGSAEDDWLRAEREVHARVEALSR